MGGTSLLKFGDLIAHAKMVDAAPIVPLYSQGESVPRIVS